MTSNVIDDSSIEDGSTEDAVASDEDGREQGQGARRFGTVALALAILVGLLLGYAGGLLTPSLRTPRDASAEAGFARDMSLHHAQAVELGMIAWRKGTVQDVRIIGYDISLGQQGQIGIMKRWLEEWRLQPTGSQPRMAWMPEGRRALQNGLMPGMATDAERRALDAASGEQFDILFCQLMIRHHLGGIHMAEGVLAQSDRPEVVALATSMKNGQQAEIAELTDILHALNASP